MPDNPRMTRRRFLQSGSVVGGAACLRLAGPALLTVTQAACTARETSALFAVLGDREAADLAAIAARIIPTTDTPGATEAGVIWFFDSAFAGAMQADLAAAREGLSSFNAALAEAQGVDSLAALGEDEQDAFLATQERSPFFELVRTMTIYGFFAMSSYGGNRDHVGWDLLGFVGHHGVWQYPFGHYDAEAHEETAVGE
jgi:gluconate 2-dehydrogenase gamma chain